MDTKEVYDLDIEHYPNFKYQLDILKLEIENIDKGIARMDEMRKAHMNWAIVTWAGGIGVLLGRPEYKGFLFLTAFIPLLFWIVGARWSLFQQAFIFRQNKISDFINSEEFSECFKKKCFSNFSVLDPVGREYVTTAEYKNKVNIWNSFKYRHILLLHLGMILISLIISLIINLL